MILPPGRLNAQLFGKGARRNLKSHFGVFDTQWTLMDFKNGTPHKNICQLFISRLDTLEMPKTARE